MTVAANTYEEVRRAIDDARTARNERFGDSGSNPSRWPQWGHLLVSVITVIVAMTLAYAALDKRISLMEQKLDYVVQQLKAR